MKRSWRLALALSLAITTTGIAAAQDEVLNPGFESWSMGEPTDWLTSNAFAVGAVAQSSDQHSGNYSIKIGVVEFLPGFTAGGFIQCPSTGGRFPVTEAWGQLRGYYQLASVGGDGIGISVSLFDGATPVGGGTLLDSNETTGWEEFIVDLEYLGGSTPDSCHIYIGIVPGGESGNGNAGSSCLIDDLIFSADTTGGGGCPIVITGDVNNSGEIVLSDIVLLVNYVLKAGPEPQPCAAAGDVNCDGQVAISDIIYLVNTVLKAGPAPCDACTLVPAEWSCP